MIEFEPISTWAPDFKAAILRHYTKSRGAPPGKKLAWRIHERHASEDGDWRMVGWIGLGEPSFKLAPRRNLDAPEAEDAAVLARARPLPFTASCFVYRLEGERTTPASELLDAWHPAATDEWDRRYGQPIVHWETMIGQGAVGNLGACFRRAGYRPLGWTTGRSARRPPGNTHGPRVWCDSEPKLVLYRGPLARKPGTTSARPAPAGAS